jgi:hypothetical protein
MRYSDVTPELLQRLETESYQQVADELGVKRSTLLGCVWRSQNKLRASQYQVEWKRGKRSNRPSPKDSTP